MQFDDEADPIDRATVAILHILGTQWSDYAAVAINEPYERAVTRLVNAGLVEAAGVLAFMSPGIATRLVVEARWSGRIAMDQLGAITAAVPEWFENGKHKGRVAIHPTLSRVRLTSIGITAQGDIRSPERQHIVLTLLGRGASEQGSLHVDTQRIERPLSS
ncbi:MAG: hypothetical protein JWP44_4440 [Mucilaginibacter sp.]|nr:hypothetical protein [Mucilaginibacter sp.]